jgi:hypothetical protein
MPFYAHRKSALIPFQCPVGRLQMVTCYAKDVQRISEIVQILEQKENPDHPTVVVSVLPGSLRDPCSFIRNLRGLCMAGEPADIVVVYPLRRELPLRHVATSILTYRHDWDGSHRLELEVDQNVYAEFDPEGKSLLVTLTKMRGNHDIPLDGPAVVIPVPGTQSDLL